MNYANAYELEAAFRSLANRAGDPSTRPFRVDLLPVHGRSGSPLCTVVMLSSSGSLLWEKLN